MQLKRLLRHSHDWNRHVFLCLYLFPAFDDEIVHVVDVRSEKADNPLVRPNVLVLFVPSSLLMFGLRVLFNVVKHLTVLPVVGLFKRLLKPMLHRFLLAAKVSDDVEFSMRRLLEHFLLNMLVLRTALEHNVIQRCILVQWDETEVVLVTKSLVKLFDVLVCLVAIHGCIELGVNDKDNASAQDVVVAQALVNRIQLAPALRPPTTLICWLSTSYAFGRTSLVQRFILDDEFNGL